jgi:muconate cycloisomerase
VIVRRIVLDEVLIPARQDSINSPEVDYALHKLPVGGKQGWTQQFDQIPKTMIQVEFDNGIVGLGESYRGIPCEVMRAVAKELLGTDLNKLNLQLLPLPAGRVYDGYECALADALAKCHHIPLYQLLGGKYRDKIRVAAWTGHRTTDDAVRKAKEAQALGYECIKFKCTVTDPVADWCREIRQACGEKFRVVLDPNERFEIPANAERIARELEEIGNVLYLEDPIPRWNYDGWRYLRGKIQIPLSMHVSLPYLEMGQMPQDAARAAKLDCNDYFHFNSGIFAFRRLTALADLFAIPYSHGSELDFGILEASYVHKVAASALGMMPSDVFGRLIREHDLLRKPLEITDGKASVPQGAGLGVELDPAAVEQYRTDHWEIEA